jgi:citrate lyase subunit beta/citryl-CoA lyase
MPGANARALEKARSLAADMLILDLEDAVAPDAKIEARAMVCSSVAEKTYGHREVLIRTNGLDTEWGRDDLSAAVAVSPDGVLVPKVTSAAEVRQIDQAMAEAGASTTMGLWVMIEMPLAILNIGEIAAAAEDTRLAGFVMGTNDLAKELNAVPTPDRAAFQVSLVLALSAARAHGLVAVDGVYNDIKNTEGFAAECEQGKILGFDGKTLIHPAQLDTANNVFSPDPDDVSHAHAVIEAFALPENQGKGVIKVNGKMTELLHLEQAQRLVAISRAIENTDS